MTATQVLYRIEGAITDPKIKRNPVRWVLDDIEFLARKVPFAEGTRRRYIEAFVGGGSMMNYTKYEVKDYGTDAEGLLGNTEFSFDDVCQLRKEPSK